MLCFEKKLEKSPKRWGILPPNLRWPPAAGGSNLRPTLRSTLCPVQTFFEQGGEGRINADSKLFV